MFQALRPLSDVVAHRPNSTPHRTRVEQRASGSGPKSRAGGRER